jgi:hypothetical protein
MINQLDLFSAATKPPLVVCLGLGRDSTAVLVGLHQRGIVPTAILFADVGAEREATYQCLDIINPWLASIGFPQVTVVRYQPSNYKHWPHYFNIEENCLTNVTLPAIAYGGHSCSMKWKISPMMKWIEQQPWAIEAWRSGLKVIKAIGFEDSPHEHRRAQRGCNTFALDPKESSKCNLWFPLQEWKWNLERCKQEIAAAGLPVPPKSSCYFCTAMKPWEVDELSDNQKRRIVIIEARVAQRNLDYAKEKGWPKGVGVPLTEGLWRRRVKGMRGATPKPGSMTEYIKEKGYLSAEDIEALQELTPTEPIAKADFKHANWQEWIADIIERAKVLASERQKIAA